MLRDVLRVWRAQATSADVAEAERELGKLLVRRGDADRARALLESARAEQLSQGQTGDVLLTDVHLVELALLEGEPGRALDLARDALERTASAGTGDAPLDLRPAHSGGARACRPGRGCARERRAGRSRSRASAAMPTRCCSPSTRPRRRAMLTPRSGRRLPGSASSSAWSPPPCFDRPAAEARPGGRASRPALRRVSAAQKMPPRPSHGQGLRSTIVRPLALIVFETMHGFVEGIETQNGSKTPQKHAGTTPQ